MNGRINECGGVEILYYSSKYVCTKEEATRKGELPERFKCSTEWRFVGSGKPQAGGSRES